MKRFTQSFCHNVAWFQRCGVVKWLALVRASDRRCDLARHILNMYPLKCMLPHSVLLITLKLVHWNDNYFCCISHCAGEHVASTAVHVVAFRLTYDVCSVRYFALLLIFNCYGGTGAMSLAQPMPSCLRSHWYQQL